MKIVEETNWLFDEIFQQVWPENIPELEREKPNTKDNLEKLLDDVLPYDMFYYYSYQPIMRYVNNYYGYEAYDPKVFKRNIEKAIDNYCNTQREKAIEYARAEALSIMEITKKNKVKIMYNGIEAYVEIKYIWRTNKADACKHCLKNDGKEFKSLKMIKTHWNCRCKIEEILIITDKNGEILHNSKKLL